MNILGLDNLQAQEGIAARRPLPATPRLLVELEPWGRTFARNLKDAVLRRKPPALRISSPPAPFWPDVFVARRLPWAAFAESLLYHGIVLALAWGLSSLLPPAPRVVQVRRFDPADVIYYSPSEYLPPLDTGKSQVTKAHLGDPVYAKQPILSVPPEADNHHQTIVTPPDIKLSHAVATPNIVAWGDHTVPVPGAALERTNPRLQAPATSIVAPVPEVNQTSDRKLNSLTQSVIAPTAGMGREVRAVASLSIDVVAPAPDASVADTGRTLRGPQAAVVEPPPAINAASVRKLGDINVGHSDVVAPAPRLAVEAQRTLSTLDGGGKAVVPPPPSMETSAGGSGASGGGGRARSNLAGPVGQVVPPPPSVPSARSSEGGGGHLIALGIHPSVTPPAEPPQGNRRGTFAAGPEGKPNAAGTPDLRNGDPSGTHGTSQSGAAGGTGSGTANGIRGVPSGLHVGAGSKNATAAEGGGDPSATGKGGSSQQEMASLTPHALPSGTAVPKATLVENPNQLERQIFHNRALYSMTLNMPNLNSAGGSWIIRFAELDGATGKGDLSAPVADHKVDPAYPLQLMRENVAGTVTLRAIIRADGSVGDIRVVNGADPRLDDYAKQAFARWHFLPAMKNDANVDVEAIVMIPFKPSARRSAF